MAFQTVIIGSQTISDRGLFERTVKLVFDNPGIVFPVYLAQVSIPPPIPVHTRPRTPAVFNLYNPSDLIRGKPVPQQESSQLRHLFSIIEAYRIVGLDGAKIGCGGGLFRMIGITTVVAADIYPSTPKIK